MTDSELLDHADACVVCATSFYAADGTVGWFASIEGDPTEPDVCWRVEAKSLREVLISAVSIHKQRTSIQ